MFLGGGDDGLFHMHPLILDEQTEKYKGLPWFVTTFKEIKWQ